MKKDKKTLRKQCLHQYSFKCSNCNAKNTCSYIKNNIYACTNCSYENDVSWNNSHLVYEILDVFDKDVLDKGLKTLKWRTNRRRRSTQKSDMIRCKKGDYEMYIDTFGRKQLENWYYL